MKRLHLFLIKSFLGPFIATLLPRKKVVTTPPIIADKRPDIGGTPDAMAIPRAKGKATNETLIAAKKSLCQFSTNPFNPFFGVIPTIYKIGF